MQRERSSVFLVCYVFQFSLVDFNVIFRAIHRAALCFRDHLQIWGCRNRHFF
uniref:Uncharacterized protein n=1 Tax=Anguilla anguilla TaxID=7936 RepID=A0A0E9W6A9_ANGAN